MSKFSVEESLCQTRFFLSINLCDADKFCSSHLLVSTTGTCSKNLCLKFFYNIHVKVVKIKNERSSSHAYIMSYIECDILHVLNIFIQSGLEFQSDLSALVPSMSRYRFMSDLKL